MTLNWGYMVLRVNSMRKTSNNILQIMGFHMAVSHNLPASFSVGLLLASFQTPSFVQLLQFRSYKGLQLEEIKKKQFAVFYV